MEIIMAAVIGAIGSVLCAVVTSRRQQRSVRGGDSGRIADSAIRIWAVLSVGFTITLVVIVVLLSQGPLKRIEMQVIKSPKTLGDFPASLVDVDIIKKLEALDEDAKGIFDGTGPRTMVVAGRSWTIGDVVYVDKMEWVDEIYPDGERENDTMNETCSIMPSAKLTVRGFSESEKQR